MDFKSAKWKDVRITVRGDTVEEGKVVCPHCGHIEDIETVLKQTYETAAGLDAVQKTSEWHHRYNNLRRKIKNGKLDQFEALYAIRILDKGYALEGKSAGTAGFTGMCNTLCSKCNQSVSFDVSAECAIENEMTDVSNTLWRSLKSPPAEILARLGMGTPEEISEMIKPNRFEEYKEFLSKFEAELREVRVDDYYKNELASFFPSFKKWLDTEDAKQFTFYLNELSKVADYAVEHGLPDFPKADLRSFLEKLRDAVLPCQGVVLFEEDAKGGE